MTPMLVAKKVRCLLLAFCALLLMASCVRQNSLGAEESLSPAVLLEAANGGVKSAGAESIATVDESAGYLANNVCGLKMLKLTIHDSSQQVMNIRVDHWKDQLLVTKKIGSCTKSYNAQCKLGAIVVTNDCDSTLRDVRGLDTLLIEKLNSGKRKTVAHNDQTIELHGEATAQVKGNLHGEIKEVQFSLLDISGKEYIQIKFPSQDNSSPVASGECKGINVNALSTPDISNGRAITRLVSIPDVQIDQYAQCTTVYTDAECKIKTASITHTDARCAVLAPGFDIQMGTLAPQIDGCLAASQEGEKNTLTCCRKCWCWEGRRSWPCSDIGGLPIF